jgi:hypothetical protein
LNAERAAVEEERRAVNAQMVSLSKEVFTSLQQMQRQKEEILSTAQVTAPVTEREPPGRMSVTERDPSARRMSTAPAPAPAPALAVIKQRFQKQNQQAEAMSGTMKDLRRELQEAHEQVGSNLVVMVHTE